MDPKNTDPIVIKLFAVVVIFVCVIIGLFGACSSGSSSGSSGGVYDSNGVYHSQSEIENSVREAQDWIRNN